MQNRIVDAMPIARKLIANYLAVKPGEEVFIVVDTETDMTMPRALAGASLDMGAEYTLAIMPSRGMGEKSTTCTDVIGKGMEGADVYISMTRTSGAAVYDGRLKALLEQKKLRECCMVMRELDNYIKGGALADYEEVYRDGQKLAEFWEGKKHIKITSPAGTDLEAEIGHGHAIIECGIARNPGDSMAFSDGEVSQGPNEGTMNGVLVIDGPICMIGTPLEPIRMTIKYGKIASLDGGDPKVLQQLAKIIDEVPNADNIAEIGLGLNPCSLQNGDFQEEKKVRGTCHIALGDNLYYDGTTKCEVHMDMIQYRPTVTMDGIDVVKDGKVILLDG